jgi:hypothetical protein
MHGRRTDRYLGSPTSWTRSQGGAKRWFGDIVRNGMWEGALGPARRALPLGLYSARRAISGSTCVARQAEPKQTTAPVARHPTAMIPKVRGSVPIFAKVGRDDGCGG